MVADGRAPRRLIPLALSGALLWLALAGAGPAGTAQAIDGDSLLVAGREVRLHGIDAPELGQSCRIAGAPWPCGLAALRALSALLRRGPAACAALETDRYGRLIARCEVAGRDLAEALVERGLAVAYTRYSDRYAAAEARARRARKGLWAGTFKQPEAWRRAQKKTRRR